MAKELTDKEKEDVIKEAMKTPEGREALAKAMGGVIARSMEIEGVFEKTIFEDNTEKGYRRCIRCGKKFKLREHNSRVGCPKCIKEIHEGKPFIMSKKKKKIKWDRFDLLNL